VPDAFVYGLDSQTRVAVEAVNIPPGFPSEQVLLYKFVFGLFHMMQPCGPPVIVLLKKSVGALSLSFWQPSQRKATPWKIERLWADTTLSLTMLS
jgi:hypothetical protein